MPHVAGKKSVSWQQDHAILDRLDEHTRLKRAGMRRQDIVHMQGISQFTFGEDEKRILAMRHHEIAVDGEDWATTVTIGLKGVIDRADAILENPLASEPRKTGALDSLIRAWAEIAKLQGAYKQPSAEAAAAPAGPAISVTNVLALVAEKAEEFTRNFPGRTLEQQLKHYGADNIRLPSRVEALIDGQAVVVEEGDDDEE